MRWGVLSIVLWVSACAARPPASMPASAASTDKQGTGGDRTGARTACTETYDCTLVDRDTCTCGMRTARDVEALATSWSDAHPHVSDGTSCPACVVQPNPDLRAVCVAHRCRVLDVAASPLSRCTTAADCVAIDGACCPPCGPFWHFLAVNRTRVSRLRTQLCGADWATAGCGACASPPAPPQTVSCEEGHCRVERDD